MARIIVGKRPEVQVKSFRHAVALDYPIDKIKTLIEEKEPIPAEAVYHTEEDKNFPVVHLIWEWFEIIIEEKTDD